MNKLIKRVICTSLAFAGFSVMSNASLLARTYQVNASSSGAYAYIKTNDPSEAPVSAGASLSFETMSVPATLTTNLPMEKETDNLYASNYSDLGALITSHAYVTYIDSNGERKIIQDNGP